MSTSSRPPEGIELGGGASLSDKTSSLNRSVTPGVDFMLARWAGHHTDSNEVLRFLKHVFFRKTVHAALAHPVHWGAVVARWNIRIGEAPFGKLLQFVVAPLVKPIFKLSDLCFHGAQVIFEHLYLVSCRRLFLLELKDGVLNVDDPFVHELRRLGELRFIACRDGLLSEINGCLQCGKGCADGSNDHGDSPLEGKVGVGTTDSTTAGNPRPELAEAKEV